MKSLLIAALTVILQACTTTETEPVYQHETEAQRIIREQQDAADFAVIELENTYARMTDEERMHGIVYEGN